jgi:S-adenosylmethionine synthetase
MLRSDYLFTSESVSEGHPDKVADEISDAVVDLFQSKDPGARVACETLTTAHGELRRRGINENGQGAPGADAEIERVIRETVRRIGDEQAGFHWRDFQFENRLNAQSAHIAQGVDASETHDEGKKQRHAYVRGAVAAVIPAKRLSNQTVDHINPTGAFEIGGPDEDTGLTGRKIIVDTYGGASPHGGGAFSGQDLTKVNRSAAYVRRYLAKNFLAAGLARRCTIQPAFAIGVAAPLSGYVDTHGTGAVGDERIDAVLPQRIRLTPRGIRTHLALNKPICQPSAAYGISGRDPTGDLFTWERTDLVDGPRAAL